MEVIGGGKPVSFCLSNLFFVLRLIKWHKTTKLSQDFEEASGAHLVPVLVQRALELGFDDGAVVIVLQPGEVDFLYCPIHNALVLIVLQSTADKHKGSGTLCFLLQANREQPKSSDALNCQLLKSKHKMCLFSFSHLRMSSATRHTHIHTDTRTHTDTDTDTRTHTDTDTDTDTHRETHRNTDRHTDRQTHAHTHTLWARPVSLRFSHLQELYQLLHLQAVLRVLGRVFGLSIEHSGLNHFHQAESEEAQHRDRAHKHQSPVPMLSK